jgi:hypothetical protein
MKSIISLALVLTSAACGGMARNATAYSADTQQLLASHNDQVKGCYDDALKADANLTGTVTIHFVVGKKTGAISNSAVDAAKSTAPDALSQCVLKGVDGLVLAPPDKNEGHATFVYEFKPTPAAAPST